MTTKPEALLLCLLLAAPLSAQPTPVGSELQINTYTTGFQFAPRVAMDPDGDFIVVWQSGTAATPGPDGDDAGIRGRRYISNGTALGSEFAVNTYTTSSQARPAVATDGLGNFIVVWQSGTFSVPGPDGDNAGIEGQRFHADATALRPAASSRSTPTPRASRGNPPWPPTRRGASSSYGIETTRTSSITKS